MSIKHLKPLLLSTALFVAVTPLLLAQETVLDGYIREGLESNIVLQQKQITRQQAEQSLEIARSYFIPSVTLLTDYTSGSGGRSIALPVGDLLNPVYATLNQLTGSDEFPQIENVKENFFPRNFYDARLRTSVPLVNTDLRVNRSIENQKVLLQGYELQSYKRQLVLDIKVAYYNHLTALDAAKIYESALVLLNKNVEVNESLLRNGKNLPASVLRSKSEVDRVKAELNMANNQVSNSRKYFNFLLNRPLDTPIIADASIGSMELLSEEPVTAVRREELAMLTTARQISESTVQLYRLSRLPKVNAFVDVGTQGTDWRVNGDSKYYLVGVQLSVPVFQGMRNSTQIRKSRLEVEKSALQLKNTQIQLQLAAELAHSNLLTTRQNYLAARQQLASAKSYFNLIEKGYQQGVYSLIEYIDARNQLTSSELQVNLRQYEVLTTEAQLERETASFDIIN